MKGWKIMRGRKIDIVELYNYYQTYFSDKFHVKLVLDGFCISMVDKDDNPFASLFGNMLFTVSPTGPDDIIQISSCPTLLETYCEKNGQKFCLDDKGDIIRAFIACVSKCLTDGTDAYAKAIQAMQGDY